MNSNVVLNNSIITENTAEFIGGGIFSYGEIIETEGSMTLNEQIYGNEAPVGPDVI